MTRAPRHRRQHGAVTLMLILVLILLAALVGALALRGAFTDLRMSSATRVSRTSFYCAEAGLNAARPTIGAGYQQWNAMLAGTAPGGQANPLSGSIAGGLGATNPKTGKPDYRVWIVDDKDEAPPAADNPTQDNDLTVIMVSVCIDPDPLNDVATTDMGGRELHEMVTYGGMGNCVPCNQAGKGPTHAGNENVNCC